MESDIKTMINGPAARRPRRLMWAVAILTCLCVIIGISPAAQAAPVTVSTGALTTSTAYNNARRIVRDSSGNLYLAYTKVSGTSQVFVSKSTDDGDTWNDMGGAPIQDIAGYAQTTPSIAIDSDDNLHVVWHGPDAGNAEYQIKYSKYSGASWSAWTNIQTVSGYYQNNPSIAVDSADNLHVVWYGQDAGNAQTQIKYTKFTGSWSAWTNIQTISGYEQLYPSIAVDSADNLHVVWYGYDSVNTGQSQIKYSKYSGAAWSAWTNIQTISGYYQYTPSIAVDSANNPHVVWWGYDSVYTAQSQIKYSRYSGAWSAWFNIQPIAGYDQRYPSIVIDGRNWLLVLWHGTDAGNPTYTQVKYKQCGVPPDCYMGSGWWDSYSNKTTGGSANRSYPAPHWARFNNNYGPLMWAWTDDTTVMFDKDTSKPQPGLIRFSDSGQNVGAEGGESTFAADLDGDGDVDIIRGNYASGNQILSNNGAGTFSVTQSLGGFGATRSVFGADVDMDGDIDFIEGNESEADRIWLNNGSGTFADSTQTLGTYNTTSVFGADVDADGDIDFIEGNSGANKVWLNNGFGTFSDSTQSLGANSTITVFGADFDGDGYIDFVEANDMQNNRVWMNDGSGNFSDSGQAFGVHSTRGAFAADFDGDGDFDFTYGCYDEDGRIWVNDGTGTFHDSGVYLGADGIRGTMAVFAADVNNDGDIDIIHSDNEYESGEVTRIFFNNTNHTNNTPAAPAITGEPTGPPGLVTLEWAAGSDTETTDTDLLQYDVRIGTSSGGCEVYCGYFPKTGATPWRGTWPGNAGATTSYSITLPVGTYYWSARTVDTTMKRSAWAAEDTFDIVVDVTPPVQSNWSPAKSATINTDAPTITFDLDENGDCKWSLADEDYDTMALGGAGRGDCTGDGTMNMTCATSGLSEGAEMVYIACQDTLANKDSAGTNEEIDYTVGIPPVQSNWSPAKSSTINTDAPTITFDLDENGDCKWSLADEDYDTMAGGGAGRGDCTGDGTTSQSCAASGLSEGAEIVYIACRDTALNEDTIATNEHVDYTVDTITNNSWITIPAGDFVMGCAAADVDCNVDGREEPKHTVTLSEYKIQKYEVTNAQYAACVTAAACAAPSNVNSQTRTPYYGNATYDNYPVIYVDWNKATTYCGWIGGRLPTEAEWEKAARGPSPAEPIYPWGDGAANCTLANYSGCTGDTDEVGSHPTGASNYGVMDLAGNVYEWVNDWYDATYYTTGGPPWTDPQGPGTGSYRVLRGGSWGNAATNMRASRRPYYLPPDTLDVNGFRCAQDIPPDTDPPIQSNWSPAKSSYVTTTSPTITLDLDENGDCKWSLTDEDYDTMALGGAGRGDCSGDGTQAISCAVTGLSEGAEVVYTACQDTLANKDSAGTNEEIDYTVDTTLPTCSVSTISESVSNAYYPGAGTEIWYENSASGGNFDVTVSASDVVSGVQKVNFPSPNGLTGCGDDTSSPYTCNFTFTTGTTQDGAVTQTVTDNVALTNTCDFTLTRDVTGPAGGSISYTDGIYISANVPVSFVNGTDAASGIATGGRVIERRVATLTLGVCGGFGGWGTLTTDPGATPYNDGSVSAGNCYQYRYVVTDNLGNSTTYCNDGTSCSALNTAKIIDISAANGTVSVSYATDVAANDNCQSRVTVTPKDALGDPLGPGLTVAVNLTLNATHGGVTDEGDGTYTALVKDAVAETTTVTATVEGVALTQSPTIQFTAERISITSTGNTFAYGAQSLNAWQATQTTQITNDGNVVQQISGQISQFTTGTKNWAIALTNGDNQCRAQWSAADFTPPAGTDITDYGAPGIFNIGTLNPGQSLDVYFSLMTPTLTQSLGPYSSTLSVNAAFDSCPAQPVCGNSIIESGETCDDGANNGALNYCNATCDGITAGSTNPWITIPAGDFVMGCATADGSCNGDGGEEPKHTVTLSEYKIQKYEVTNAQYAACVTAAACTAPSSANSSTRAPYYGNATYDNYPVIYVNWTQAGEYCAWISGRLPTEAEWEKAARGPYPAEPIYPWGDGAANCTLAEWWNGCTGDTAEVGSHPTGASNYGVMDLAGNVYEWVNDWYDATYYTTGGPPWTDPQGPGTGSIRVLRGGAWFDNASNMRASDRSDINPAYSDDGIGFRCAQD